MASLFSLFFLPVISFLSGIASLQIDPKSNKRWILILIMAASATGSVVLAASDNRAKANQDAIINKISEVSQKIDATTQSTQTTVQDIGQQLSSFGFSKQTVTAVQQAVKANQALNTLRPAVVAANRQKAVAPTIMYYPKDVDGPKVVNALEEAGFKVTQGVGNPNNANLPTNSVWAGDVSLEQAKFVALTLVRAGVNIRFLGRIEKSAKDQNIIQVGASQQHKDDQVLTVDAIQELQSFM